MCPGGCVDGGQEGMRGCLSSRVRGWGSLCINVLCVGEEAGDC